MAISYLDQRPASERSITASLSGDVLTINGIDLDFTGMSDGDIYPRANLDGDIFASDVTRAAGELFVTLIRPVDRLGVPLTGMDGAVTDTILEGAIVAAADVAAAELQVIRAGMSLSFAQLLIGLVTEGWITEAEGDAWSSGGPLPATAIAAVDALPAAQRFAARARMLRMSEAIRLDPLVAALAAAYGKTDSEIDTFFATYSAI